MLPIPGLLLIEPRVHVDDRGYFLEMYKESEFRMHGISIPFVQDNHSLSFRGVVRGLHFQREPREQGKLVRAVHGLVWDVAVDVRPGSPTFGRWYGTNLSSENQLMMYIPPGFAHGFQTLSEEAHFCYKCTAEYDRESEGGIRWDDPDLAIPWPLPGTRVSEKDASLPFLKDLR